MKEPGNPPAEIFTHVPNKTNPGERKLVYAWAGLGNGGYQMEVLSKDDVMAAKEYSRRSDDRDSPWNRHTEDMWRKTAIRKLCKYLPLTPDVQAAISEDTYNEFGDPSALPREVAEVIDVTPDVGEPSQAARRAVDNANQNTSQPQQPPKREEPPPQEEPPPDLEGWDDPLPAADGFQ
jgi:recombinational DNA repair protein RecT